MKLSERILFALCRRPEQEDYYSTLGQAERRVPQDALALLEREYRGFGELVKGKRVLDFGCGQGHQCIALAKTYGCHVVGLETNARTMAYAAELAKAYGVGSDTLNFYNEMPEGMWGTFDIVISQNSFEHFDNPEDILRQMKLLAKPTGKILVTFGPPWFSPYGSHTQFFCKVPWINIVFSESTVWNVRRNYRQDSSAPYEGLNKMTIRKFERIIDLCGMRAELLKYTCVRRMNFFAHIPVVRELMINHVTVMLSQ